MLCCYDGSRMALILRAFERLAGRCCFKLKLAGRRSSSNPSHACVQGARSRCFMCTCGEFAAATAISTHRKKQSAWAWTAWESLWRLRMLWATFVISLWAHLDAREIFGMHRQANKRKAVGPPIPVGPPGKKVKLEPGVQLGPR